MATIYVAMKPRNNSSATLSLAIEIRETNDWTTFGLKILCFISEGFAPGRLKTIISTILLFPELSEPKFAVEIFKVSCFVYSQPLRSFKTVSGDFICKRLKGRDC
jgi:hypothetical protein